MNNIYLAKIKEYKAAPRGISSVIITLPQVYVKDNKINPGDKIEIYRGFVDGRDALIIIPKKSQRTKEKLSEAV